MPIFYYTLRWLPEQPMNQSLIWIEISDNRANILTNKNATFSKQTLNRSIFLMK